MTEIQQEYRGFRIVYSESGNVWQFFSDGTWYEASSLGDAKSKIDAMQKKAFKRIPVYVGNHGPLGLAVITSIRPNGDVFIVPEGKKSAEKIYGRAYVQNEANQAKVAEIHALETEKKKIEDRVSEIRKALEPVDLQAVKKELGI